MVRCYIGLGSNLNNPKQQLQCGLTALNALPQTRLVTVSSFYQTAPVGPQDQPDFINAAAAIDTQLSATTLLTHLLEIERKQDRIRQQRWGPRTLDLDLLLYGSEIINEPGLTVPHPQLCHRQFVLIPLLEIAPEVMLPSGERLCDVASNRSAPISKTPSLANLANKNS